MFLQKTLAIINAELNLLDLRIKHPEPFQQQKERTSISPLYLTTETYLVEIMEIVSGLFLEQNRHLQKSEEHLNGSERSNWAIFIRSMKALLAVNHPK